MFKEVPLCWQLVNISMSPSVNFLGERAMKRRGEKERGKGEREGGRGREGENHQESKTELKQHKKSIPPIHWCIAAGLSATRLNTRPTVITANELGLKNNHTHTHTHTERRGFI